LSGACGRCKSAAPKRWRKAWRDQWRRRRPGRTAPRKLPPLWDRLQAQIDDAKAKANQRYYKASKIAILLCAIIIPIVAAFTAMAVIIAAGHPAAREHATCEGLCDEQHLYNEKAGPYAKLPAEEAHRLLAERIGALASAEHSKWAAVVSEKVRDHAGE
jgi:hypothetical protein